MKKINVWNSVLTAVAAGFGLVTLLGYFIDAPVLLLVRLQFVAWASVLAAVAVVIGVLSLLGIHFKKLMDGTPGWFYSVFLLLALVIVLVLGFVAPFLGWGSGPGNQGSLWVFRYIQSSSGAAISGLIVFSLVFAGYRLLRRRITLMSGVFLGTAIISLLGMATLPIDVGLRDLWIWIAAVPAVGGARGLLIGITLGIVATGLRVLLAFDRPYGD